MPRHPREAFSGAAQPRTVVRSSRVATPRGRLLGNGRYRVLFTTAGTGGSWVQDQALTCWRGDRVEDGDGWFIYLRDLADGVFWSLGYRPVPTAPERYAVEEDPSGVAIVRRDRGIESRLEVWVDAEESAECRRVTLSNLTSSPRRIELTSYLEVVIQDPRQYAAHPAFSKLFVQTESVADQGVLLARRRPRSPAEGHPWLAQALHGAGEASFETDRARFLGRGRGPDRPLALVSTEPLTQSVGDVLDPVLALRRVVELRPGGAVGLGLALAAAPTREHALEVSSRLATPGGCETSRRRTAARVQGRLERHGLSARDGERLERLAAAMLYGDPALRPVLLDASARALRPVADVLSLLPTHAPLLLVEPGADVSGTLAAQAYWRDLGLRCGVVLLAEDPSALAGTHGLDGRADVAVVAARGLDDPEIAALRAEVDLVVHNELPALESALPVDADGAPLAMVARDGEGREPLGVGPRRHESPPPASSPPAPPSAPATGEAQPAPATGETPPAPAPDTHWPFGDEPLRCFNGYGGFTPRGDEYVIRLPRSDLGMPRMTPRPWINVLANPGFGAIVSETGAGCTWSRNSREFRLTPWRNDPVRDPHDEAVYVRDEDSGQCWSPFPGPIPGHGPYEMRHGFGHSRCRHASGGLEIETDVFVHASDPVKVIQVQIFNPGARPRRLSLVTYQRLVLGELPDRAARTVITWADDLNQILMARRIGPGAFADATAFAAPVVSDDRSTVRLGGDREAFVGPGGTPARPAALRRDHAPGGLTGADLEPCFTTQLGLEVGPGESRSCAFLLGEAPGPAAILKLVRRLRRPGALDRALEQVRSRWRDLLGRVWIETPVESIDLMVNGWLAHQTLACRLWARAALYQSGGAYGYRDQLQDAASLLDLEPSITRDQLLLHAAHQFVEGDVLHWWHPPGGRGLRTRFADDLLWLPFTAAAYVRGTGDERVLEERVPFLEARPLGPQEDEAYLLPRTSEEVAELYEHCCRAIDRSLLTGPHGLPLIGSGDWNDGMNRVGREGRGESVWMACFLFAVLDGFLPLCEARADAARVTRYQEHRQRLQVALEAAGWDGGWYRRGYFDDGTPLGSRESEECRIDALVQAWAVLSGAAKPERCERAMDAVERHLVSWDDGLIRLLWPPFDRTPHDPGYIKAYVPGVRENGGQYTHAALWVIAALARLGRREAVARLLKWMSPVTRSLTSEAAEIYQAEPYAVAADICTNPRYPGRAGWTWYTGSSGWMMRIALESLLGVSLEEGRTLVVRAAIPGTWPGYRLRLRPWGRRGCCEVVVRNSSGRAAEVVGVLVDGKDLGPEDGCARVPLPDDGVDHRVDIELR